MNIKQYNLLLPTNPWWDSGDIPFLDQKLPHRQLYFDIVDHFLPGRIWSRPIIGVTGLRRVGKTTMVWQIIATLLKSERAIKPKNILYIIGDDPSLVGKWEPDFLVKLIDGFVQDAKEEKYIFIDEIQEIPFWEKQLKYLVELKRELRIFVTGSSSMLIEKGSQESLVGRITTHTLWPLSFQEFFILPLGKLRSTTVDNLIFQNKSWKSLLNRLLNDGSYTAELEKTLLPTFEEYLLVGGFPEYFKTKPGIPSWHILLKEDVIKRQLFIDLPKVFGVGNPEYLENMLALVAQNQAQQMLPNTFFEALPIGNKQTILKYLTYLEKSFLLLRIPQWIKGHASKYHKMLVRDPGIAAMLNSMIDLKNTSLVGRLVEAVVHHQVATTGDLRYFRDAQGHEVDGVILGKDYTWLYEATYGETEITKADYRNLLYLATRKKGIKRVFLLTRTNYDYRVEDGIEIITIPVWLWLWLAPRMEESS